MDDQTGGAAVGDRKVLCDHRCLLLDGRDGLHQHGYHLPARPTGRWRVGSKVGRTIYLQRGPEPDHRPPPDGDPLIGVMDTPELAALAVDSVNRAADSLAAPVDGDLRESLMAAAEEPVADGLENGLDAATIALDVADELAPIIAAHVAERERAAQQRVVEWMAVKGQADVRGWVLEAAEQAIEAGDV